MYYIYAYLREDGSPYYIGKGKGKRYIVKRSKHISIPKDINRITFLLDKLTEEEAFEWEKFFISAYGRKDLGTGILRNLTAGGEGTSGYKHLDSTKKQMSLKRKGKKRGPFNDEWRKNIAKSNIGKNLGEKNPSKRANVRKKISISNTGKKRTYEQILNISKAHETHIWEILHIDSSKIFSTNNRTQFCKKMGLNKGDLLRTFIGKLNQTKGYKIISKKPLQENPQCY